MDMQGTDEEKVQAELKSELSDGCVDFLHRIYLMSLPCAVSLFR